MRTVIPILWSHWEFRTSPRSRAGRLGQNLRGSIYYRQVGGWGDGWCQDALRNTAKPKRPEVLCHTWHSHSFFFFLRKLNSFILVVLSLLLCGFSSVCGEQGLLCRWVHGLLIAMASCEQGLESTAVVAHVAARQHLGSSWPRNRIHVSSIGKWIPIHCPTREVL